MGGDHCSTEFLFHLKGSSIHETTEIVYNYSKLKVMDFTQYVEDHCPEIYEGLQTGTLETLNNSVNKFYKIIHDGLELHCPTKIIDKRKVSDHTKAWWDKTCQKHKRKLTKIKSYVRKSNKVPLPCDRKPQWCRLHNKEEIHDKNNEKND